MKIRSILFVSILVLIIVMQFFGPGTENQDVEDSADYLEIARVPDETAVLIRNACYDCHSYQTAYPWYSKVAPVSWMIHKHVEEGRDQFTFSEWGDYDQETRGHILEECAEEIEEGEMPLSSYLIIHRNARFSDDEKEAVIRWFEQSSKQELADIE